MFTETIENKELWRNFKMLKLFQTKEYPDSMVLFIHLLELRSQANGNVIYLRKHFLRQKAHIPSSWTSFLAFVF